MLLRKDLPTLELDSTSPGLALGKKIEVSVLSGIFISLLGLDTLFV